MPEAWINGIIQGTMAPGLQVFQSQFVAMWITFPVANSTDAMGVMCMGGEL